MKICIGIPAFKAFDTIEECISSINIQSMRSDINVIIANDEPEDNGKYNYLSEKFKKLHFTFLDCKKNEGPGVARNRCIEASNDDFIAFIDADDIFYTPFAIENLYNAVNQPNVVQSQSIFAQPIKTPNGTQLFPYTNVDHPWSFARMTNVRFLKSNGITFGKLRSMEDGYMQHCIRLLIEGTQLKRNIINDIGYIWKEGSEHSITRAVAKDINPDIPIYNFGHCQLGASKAFKDAIDFARSKNPFNGNLSKFAAEQMVNHYFTYYECLEKYPEFADMNWWNSKYFYNECYIQNCQNVSFEILESIFMQYLSVKGKDFKKFPEMTFKQWFDKISTEDFNIQELQEIQDKLPESIKEQQVKSGQNIEVFLRNS